MPANFALALGVLVVRLCSAEPLPMQLAAADANAAGTSEHLDDIVAGEQSRRGERHDSAELPGRYGPKCEKGSRGRPTASESPRDPRTFSPVPRRGGHLRDDERVARSAREQRYDPRLARIVLLTHSQAHALSRIVRIDLREGRGRSERTEEREGQKCDPRAVLRALGS
jgi:hypothetical protein